MSDDVIDALAIVLPDGTVLWTDEITHQRAAELIARWKDDLPQQRRDRYEEAKVLGGVVQVRMLRSDFEAQPGRLAP